MFAHVRIFVDEMDMFALLRCELPAVLNDLGWPTVQMLLRYLR